MADYITIQLSEIPWIRSVPLDNQKNELLKIIALGKSVLEITQISINPSNSLFEPLCKQVNGLETCITGIQQNEESKLNNTRLLITENLSTTKNQIVNICNDIKSERMNQRECLDKVNKQLEIFTKASQTSSLKGKMSESMVESTICNFFKEDCILNTSKQAMAGDYHLQCKDGYNILIEVKNYKDSVNQKEVDKFKRDVQHNKMDGLFLSTSSHIVKKGLLEIEELPSGETTVYLSNTGITGESIIMGILLLKELQSRKKKTKLSVVSINTDLILENIEKFTDLCKIICKLTQTIYDLKEKVCNNLQELHNESYKCELEIKNVLKSIQYEIVNEFNKINSEITLIEKDELTILLDEIKLNENKLYPYMLIVVDIIETHKLKFCNIQNKWGILNMNDELICDIKKYKTKLELKFTHKLTHKIQLDISLSNKDLIISEILKKI